ncbi:MAG TPA: hypothetical protein VLA49_12585 [Anaerolineales bacterium]|nr:hypothetical protein [Anaerolineales bacterium]
MKRYGCRFENHRLPNMEQKRQELAETIGQGSCDLLECIYQKETTWSPSASHLRSPLRWVSSNRLPPQPRLLSPKPPPCPNNPGNSGNRLLTTPGSSPGYL